jgi:Putative papain-like cysteine peptidase (DUF1796)
MDRNNLYNHVLRRKYKFHTHTNSHVTSPNNIVTYDYNNSNKDNSYNYVCSLGTLCQTGMLLKSLNLKLASYPFDWIFSNPNMIIDCIENKFEKFLDKSHYLSIDAIKNGRCTHLIYGKNMFNHHNPLINEDEYQYFIRCVKRFNELIEKKEKKLFIIIHVNQETTNIEEIKQLMIDFNNKFILYTSNYDILVIYHISLQKRTVS